MDGQCVSDCPTICDPCPPLPEPVCVAGQCMPAVGCSNDDDCLLGRECVCDCPRAMTLSEIATDPCLTTEEAWPEGCFDCELASDCSPCVEGYVGAECVDGECREVFDPEDAFLRECGGPFPSCPEGFFCVPDLSTCGSDAYGVCYPVEGDFCDGHAGLTCPDDGSVCLSTTYALGLCLQPEDALFVCEALPNCFVCVADSGSGD